MKGTHEAFSSVIHVPDLEAVLVSEGLGQRLPQRVRRQARLVAVLELREYHLQQQKEKQHLVARAGVNKGAYQRRGHEAYSVLELREYHLQQPCDNREGETSKICEMLF